MPDNFRGNVLINELGTISGGLVLASLLGVIGLHMRRFAHVSDREYESTGQVAKTCQGRLGRLVRRDRGTPAHRVG